MPWAAQVHDGDWGTASQYNSLLSNVQTWPGDVSAGANNLVAVKGLTPSGVSIAMNGDVDFQGHVLKNIGNGSLTAGAGISVNAATITNTSPNVQADWNASSGLAAILNKPAGMAPQVQVDWNATTGISSILNKPPITYSSPTTTISSSLAVTSNASVGGTLGVTGAVTCSSTLQVSGTTT